MAAKFNQDGFARIAAHKRKRLDKHSGFSPADQPASGQLSFPSSSPLQQGPYQAGFFEKSADANGLAPIYRADYRQSSQERNSLAQFNSVSGVKSRFPL
jgi:hypothetical protein